MGFDHTVTRIARRVAALEHPQVKSGRFGARREMAQRATFYAYVLVLLICSSVAAKPINKPAKTAAVHPPAAPKEVKSDPPVLKVLASKESGPPPTKA